MTQQEAQARLDQLQLQSVSVQRLIQAAQRAGNYAKVNEYQKRFYEIQNEAGQINRTIEQRNLVSAGAKSQPVYTKGVPYQSEGTLPAPSVVIGGQTYSDQELQDLGNRYLQKPAQEDLQKQIDSTQRLLEGAKRAGNQQAISEYQQRYNNLVNQLNAGNFIDSHSGQKIPGAASPEKTFSQSTAAGGQQTDTFEQALSIIDSSGLPDDVKALFRQTVANFDPSKEINTQNILNEFERIRKETIDPNFEQLTRIAIDEVRRGERTLAESFALEQETNAINAGQRIENAQADLESRGLTFSGQGLKALGARGAFAQPGQRSSIPTQFGIPEGTVNQQNRLISTSSEARNRQAREDLARRAELSLGSAGAGGLVPGVSQLGGVTGTIEQQKKQAEAGLLSSLSGQENFNSQVRNNPLQFNFAFQNEPQTIIR